MMQMWGRAAFQQACNRKSTRVGGKTTCLPTYSPVCQLIPQSDHIPKVLLPTPLTLPAHTLLAHVNLCHSRSHSYLCVLAVGIPLTLFPHALAADAAEAARPVRRR